MFAELDVQFRLATGAPSGNGSSAFETPARCENELSAFDSQHTQIAMINDYSREYTNAVLGHSFVNTHSVR